MSRIKNLYSSFIPINRMVDLYMMEHWYKYEVTYQQIKEAMSIIYLLLFGVLYELKHMPSSGVLLHKVNEIIQKPYIKIETIDDVVGWKAIE